MEKIVYGTTIENSQIVYKAVGNELVKGLFLKDKNKYVWYPEYWVGSFNNGLATIENDDYAGYINLQGEKVYLESSILVNDFSEGRAFIDKDDKTYLIDTNFATIKEFDDIYNTYLFNENHSIITSIINNGNTKIDSLIDINGEVVLKDFNTEKIMSIEMIGNAYNSIGSGLLKVKRKGQYGFINFENKLVIPCEYDFAHCFENGLCLVFNDKYSQVINTKGEVVSPEFDDFIHYNNQLLYFVKDEKKTIYDCLNNSYLEGIDNYDEIYYYDRDIIIWRTGTDYYLTKLNEGETISFVQVDKIYDYKEGLFLGELDNKRFITDLDEVLWY